MSTSLLLRLSKTRRLKQEVETTTTIVDNSNELKTFRKLPNEKPAEFPSSVHRVVVGDWESKIQWAGYISKEKKKHENQNGIDHNASPPEFLGKCWNPLLDNLDFDNMISWSGDNFQAKTQNLPLILERGVAGQSIKRQLLPSHRPTPFAKSMEYKTRIAMDADKEKKERFIHQRNKTRRQLAKSKTNRLIEAMGSTDYVEQPAMVTNHTLFRDLCKVSLRQLHRPKLPRRIVRTSLLWRFGVRFSASNQKGGLLSSVDKGGLLSSVDFNSCSYQAMMMGTHTGAASKAKVWNESDLSPAEGKLVLFEYCEERPPIQMTKGMASKIVTYYRGDKAHCPVSAGGGDRPTKQCRSGTEADNSKKEKLHQLKGPNHAMGTTITDWVGKPPKKDRDSQEKSSINILPEGVTEILHPKVHGPFIGEIEEGQAVTGLMSNLFVAPMVRHEPESTDFLMILGRYSGASTNGCLDTLSITLRELPTSSFTVGQTEPRTRVFAPTTQGEKKFIENLVSHQIANVLTQAESQEGHGLQFDEIRERVMPNAGLKTSILQKGLKNVAVHDKNTKIWTAKQIGYEAYPGVDALGKQLSAEGVAAYEVSNAAVTRLNDLGIHQLFSGPDACKSVGVAMTYLAGQVNATTELARKIKNLTTYSRRSRPLQMKFYEQAATELEALSKELGQRLEVAKFIFEELQLAPWHLTGEFFDVHKNSEGTGMMRLTGLGDPSGIGEGFSYLRQSKKGNKTVAKDKIVGTEDDLRKLTMKQMANILRSYGLGHKEIDTLKRWGRVRAIRSLSTKAASDGIGDGLERFARGEKMKLSDQKQMYRDRIQVIWRRQLAHLSVTDSGESRDIAGGGPAKLEEAKKDDDADFDDADFAAAMEEEMMDEADAKKLVVAQANERSGGGLSILGMRSAIQDQDLMNEARELAALKRQNAEGQAMQAQLQTLNKEQALQKPLLFKRKIVRKRITKTYPDGRQTTTFKFIVHPEEVDSIMERLLEERREQKPKPLERPVYHSGEKQVGHAMFEAEDGSTSGLPGCGGKNCRRKRRGRGAAKGRPERLEKRLDEAEFESFASVSKCDGTSDRKKRRKTKASQKGGDYVWWGDNNFDDMSDDSD